MNINDLIAQAAQSLEPKHAASQTGDARDLQNTLEAEARAIGAPATPQDRAPAGVFDFAQRRSLSRAAQLNLIDALSRFGASGLGLIAGLTIFGATYLGRAYPFRASVWAVLVFAGLYLCRRYRFEYRAGKAFAGRPFRWRTHYTAALAVLSAGFGAGAFLVSPAAAGPGHALQTHAALGVGLIVAALLQSAHGASARAAFLPGTTFVLAASLSRLGAGFETMGLTAVAIAAWASLNVVADRVAARADARFPRAEGHARESLLAPRQRGAGRTRAAEHTGQYGDSIAARASL